MVSVVSVTPPDVVMRASAKRVFPLHLLAISTRVWSAVLSMSTRSASALAWSRVSSWEEAIDGRGVCIPQLRAVLRIVTFLNRAGTQPWLTELLCEGSPLPSLNAPPSQYDDLPPIMSIEFQNTGVFAWYATSRSRPATLPLRIS